MFRHDRHRNMQTPFWLRLNALTKRTSLRALPGGVPMSCPPQKQPLACVRVCTSTTACAHRQTQTGRLSQSEKYEGFWVLHSLRCNRIDVASLGEPLLNVTLQAGDFLYVPRRAIHQTSTLSCGSGYGFCFYSALRLERRGNIALIAPLPVLDCLTRCTLAAQVS